jgi:hypothetical protein
MLQVQEAFLGRLWPPTETDRKAAMLALQTHFPYWGLAALVVTYGAFLAVVLPRLRAL